jgi:hypothetical protein
VITRGRFKHPGRHFQRSIVALVVHTAPTHAVSALGQRLVHPDRATEPRMPRITHFSGLSTMGVELSTCTTAGGAIPPSAMSVPSSTKLRRP